MKITEAIHVNHELDLLEAHIIEASKYADRIVVKEGEANWNGKEKPLHVQNAWDRFKKYPKVELMVIPFDEFVVDPQNKKEQCLNETKTRTYGWQDVSDSVDYVIESDVDEIIDVSLYPILLAEMEKDRYLHVCVTYLNHLWYMNNVLNKHREYRVFKTGEPEICLLPKHRDRTTITTIGWHFFGCTSGEDWGRKYTDMNFIYGFDNDEIGDYDWNRFRETRTTVNGAREEVELQGTMLTKVNLSTYPDFVRDHPELFPWWGDPEFI